MGFQIPYFLSNLIALFRIDARYVTQESQTHHGLEGEMFWQENGGEIWKQNKMKQTSKQPFKVFFHLENVAITALPPLYLETV